MSDNSNEDNSDDFMEQDSDDEISNSKSGSRKRQKNNGKQEISSLVKNSIDDIMEPKQKREASKRGPSRDAIMTDFQTNERSRDLPRNTDQRRMFSKNYMNPDDKILNKANLREKIVTALKKYGLNKTNFQEVENVFSLGLEEYMKNIIESLIKISRVRNLNLNLYSKMAEKNQVLNIHTLNYEKSSNNYEPSPFRQFSIVFTKNMKNVIEKLNSYEELSSSKNQFEKITSFKNKMEQAAEQKEKEKEKTSTAQTNQPKAKRRSRETQYMKLCKKELEKNKQKEDKNRQKKDSLDTLKYFLDKPKSHREYARVMDSEMGSNMNESQQNLANVNIETHTKLSDNISKSENYAFESNDLFLTVYKSHIPNENPKINSDVRRRIIVKDLIFYLENNLKTPLHNLILHKAILKLNQNSNA